MNFSFGIMGSETTLGYLVGWFVLVCWLIGCMNIFKSVCPGPWPEPGDCGVRTNEQTYRETCRSAVVQETYRETVHTARLES